MKHFTIPIFVPELACPNRCVFCNQHSISGCRKQPEPEEVSEIILNHLKTIPEKDSHIEIGFFGGSFTGIEPEIQEKYLATAAEFLRSGRITGIRLSTRPDYINAAALNMLKNFGVTTIELGAQSLDEEVLRLSGRGHTVGDVEKASEMILSAGFKLGLQMMTGLPGDTAEKSVMTARRIVELGAHCTRIYPTLVIKGTDLEKLFLSGDYTPQSLDEAVELSAQLIRIFKEGGVDIIRVGLHPSEDLINGGELLAGPFHPSFRELAETCIWKNKLIPLMEKHPEGGNLRVPVKAGELRYAIGYDSSNRKMLEAHFSKVEFEIINQSENEKPLIITDKKLPLPAKNALKTIGQPLYLETELYVYKSISGHPDIFLCQGNKDVVTAPGVSDQIKKRLNNSAFRLIEGYNNPGKLYPESARYNAVVTDEYIIHNLKITDPAIFETFTGRKLLHVNQGYTRCNLIETGKGCFITSDKGIEKALSAERKQVLFVDPRPVKLKGQQYGFFPGCCGIFNDEVLIAGSLNHHPDGNEIRNFIEAAGLKVRELYDGALFDVGGIFVFPANQGKNDYF